MNCFEEQWVYTAYVTRATQNAALSLTT